MNEILVVKIPVKKKGESVHMKKVVAMVLSLVMALGLMAGCGQKDSGSGAKTVESLKIAFSPYADADQITTATEPLEALLKAKLLEKGYEPQGKYAI